MPIGSQVAIILGAEAGSRIGIYYAAANLAFRWIVSRIENSEQNNRTEQRHTRPLRYSTLLRYIRRIIIAFVKAYFIGGAIGAILGLLLFRNMIRVNEIPVAIINLIADK